MDNGCWGYRFIVTVDGKRKTQKRVKDEMGKPYKTEKQAAKVREKAISMEKTRMLLPPQKKIVRRTVEDVYKEYCEVGRSEKAYATRKSRIVCGITISWRDLGIGINYICSTKAAE